MCGIAGLFDLRGRRDVDPSVLHRITGALHHRGPDGDGFHMAPGIGFGHRRLAIIDLAGGAQPLFNEEGTVCVTYNGEIFNFRELAQELTERGHRFRTHCDTEVIVHAWEEWGEACVERFDGQFAFAVWDARADRLFLARDRAGEKPLYYSVLPDGWLVFGSELKALRQHPRLPTSIDPQAVEDYFAYGYVPEPKSIFRGVRKLPAAHSMTVSRDGRMDLRPYWDLRFEPRSVALTDAVDGLRAMLDESVRKMLVSDVPLGAFLSGGVDSSGVVASMAQAAADPVRTFAISFDDPSFDEAAHAARVAQRYATRHVVQQARADDMEAIERLPAIYDEPFADSSALPTLRLCELTRRHVTVALSGDGGDEVFAGYRRYRFHRNEERLRRLLPASVRGPAFGALAAIYPKLDRAPRWLRAKSTFEELALDSELGFFNAVAVVGDRMRTSLFSDAMRRELQGYHAASVLAGHFRAAGTDDPVAMAQYADFKTWLPGDILVKVDRASMANSLEVRVPILDRAMLDWAATLPSSLKLHGADGKHVLKKALEPRVPRENLYRPKQGFSAPLARWLRGPLRDRLCRAVVSPILLDTGYFDPDALRGLADRHLRGVNDHAPVLWSLLMFEGFLRHTVGADVSIEEKAIA